MPLNFFKTTYVILLISKEVSKYFNNLHEIKVNVSDKFYKLNYIQV